MSKHWTDDAQTDPRRQRHSVDDRREPALMDRLPVAVEERQSDVPLAEVAVAIVGLGQPLLGKLLRRRRLLGIGPGQKMGFHPLELGIGQPTGEVQPSRSA